MVIRNIIFDFGDVFIDLDKEAPLRELQKWGVPSWTRSMHTIHEAYERGSVTTEQITSFYLSHLEGIGQEMFKEAFNSIIGFFPEDRLLFIERLAREQNYRLFLLSNTNALHIAEVIDHMELPRYKRFQQCFERFYLSHEIGMRKPDEEIYQFVLEENALIPAQTLFVDDTAANTDAAKALGLQTWNLQPGKEDVQQLLDRVELSW